MDSAPLNKLLNEDNVTSSKQKDSSSLEKRVYQRKGIFHSIKLERKKIDQREIRLLESINHCEKRKGHPTS